MFPESLLFPRNMKQYNYLSRISFKLVPLCNYTPLSATVKVSETFLEAFLWTPFQLFCRILNDVTSTTKSPSLQCWFQSREQLKISWIQMRVWDAPMLSHFSLLRNPWPNRQVWWSIVVKEKPAAGSPFFGTFPSDLISKATKDVDVRFCSHNCTIFLMQQFLKLHQRIPGTFWRYYTEECLYPPYIRMRETATRI